MKAKAHHIHPIFPAGLKTQGSPLHSKVSKNAFRYPQRVFLSLGKIKV